MKSPAGIYAYCCPNLFLHSLQFLLRKEISHFDSQHFTNRCSEFVSENMNVSNCLEMMILSDTLAINGVFNKAVKIALWDAHTVTHSEDFLQISQVLYLTLAGNTTGIGFGSTHFCTPKVILVSNY